MTGLLLCKILVLITCLGLALYNDLKEHKIKNSITFPTAISGLVLNAAENGWPGLLLGFKGWAVPVALLFGLYVINVMGAGDIKLFAAIGAVMGMPFALYSIAFSIYFGAVIALFMLIKRKQLQNKVARLMVYLKYVLLSRRLVPYCAENDNSSKFMFSTAVIPGTLLQLFLLYQGYAGI